MHTLGVITARGGSKGLPQKNIIELVGKPVIAYSIEAAVRSQHLSRVIVSTDDPQIADIARQYGAEVPFLRPAELASDTVTHVPVLQHAISFVEEETDQQLDAVVLLQPTSPLRRAVDIDGAIELFCERSVDSVISVVPTIYVVEEREDGTLRPILQSEVGYFHRTLPNKFYDFNGAVYVTRRREIMEHNRIMGERTLPYVMEQRYSFELDSREDLDIISALLERGQ